MATVLLGLFGNGMVDAFYRCQTPISLSHFGMEGEQGPAQPNRAYTVETGIIGPRAKTFEIPSLG
jgi:hypothetical protein